MGTDPADAAMVRTAIDLGRRLGTSVAAEGVENEATLRRLTDFGAMTAQGFHIARPMPAADVEAWLAAGGFVYGPTTKTSSVRGPWTPSTRSSSMSDVAEGPETNVTGRPAAAASARAATASGTPATMRSASTTHTW